MGLLIEPNHARRATFLPFILLHCSNIEWLIKHGGKTILLMFTKLGLFLARLFLGDEEANRIKNSFIESGKVKRSGIFAIIGGTILFLPGLLFVVETIKRIRFMP